jgi:predicted phosphoribosyltransferase
MAPLSSSRNADTADRFANRRAAGEQLAAAILKEMAEHPVQGASACVAYALPRGGLPVAVPIAQTLHCPLDVIVAKKITAPENRELALGAVTADGHVIWSSSRRAPSLSSTQQDEALQQAQSLALAQASEFFAASSHHSPEGGIALVIDDGIATGMTMAVAVQSLRSHNPAAVWICAPVAPLELMPFLHSISDRVIVLTTPTPFYSVSRFYIEFPQVSTEEAIECLWTTRTD